MASEFPFARADRPFDSNGAGKIAPPCTKKFRKLPEIADRPRNLAAKIRIQPIRGLRGQRALAIQGQLVLTLFDIKLLELDLAVVKHRPDHDQIGGAVVPAQSIQLRPNRGRSSERIPWVAAKSEVAGAQ